MATKKVTSKEIHKGARIAEIYPARKWYGKWSTGSVVLVSGRVYFHGTQKEAREFFDNLK